MKVFDLTDIPEDPKRYIYDNYAPFANDSYIEFYVGDNDVDDADNELGYEAGPRSKWLMCEGAESGEKLSSSVGGKNNTPLDKS